MNNKKNIKKIVKCIKNNINYILLLLLLLLLFKFISIYYMDYVQKIDDWVIYFFQKQIINDKVTAMMKYITYFGDKIVISIILLLSIILIKNKKYPFYMTVNVLLVVMLNTIIKLYFKRIRPYASLVKETGYSFPSGHSMCGIAFYGLFLYFILTSKMKKVFKWCFSFMFVLLIIFIGISRISLNVHYFSDVVSGFLLGLVCLLTIIKFIKEYEGEKI